MSWLEHWGLKRDPFGERGGIYVPLAGHEEAVARLLHAVDAGHALAVLRASTGMGKSLVLSRALAEARHPRRRFARVLNPLDGGQLFQKLAGALGTFCPDGSGRIQAWQALEQAVRAWVAQGFQVVLAVDEGWPLVAGGGAMDLLHLRHLAGRSAGRVTVVLVLSDEGLEPSGLVNPWTLAIGLKPLSCSEVETYLSAKLAAAGNREQVFGQRAATRLHLHSRGNPARLDGLAALCLMAAADRKLEAIASGVVENIVGQCHLPEECLQVP